jgi:type IV pilus assembly protein PilY1
VQRIDTLTNAAVENLTGVPAALAQDFTTWLREYNKHQILGDMESSGMQVVEKPVVGSPLLSNPLAADRDQVLYVQTNRGVLHAINYANGSERWAFFPPNVFQTRLKATKYDAITSALYSGDGVNTVASIAYNLLDGPMTKGEVSLTYNASNYRTIILGNMGFGGNGLYAMDVTEPAATPTFLWAVDNDRYDGGPSSEIGLWGNSVGMAGTSAYSQLGLTIAPGVFLQADVSAGDKRNVIFLPGGLGQNLGSDDQGKAFYVIAPSTGEVLKAFTQSNGFEPVGASLGMGIAPVTVRHVKDSNRDIELFTTDSAGNVLYCDTTQDVSSWTLKSVFQLKNSGGVPVSIPKAVSLGTVGATKQMWVFGGSARLDAPGKDADENQKEIVNAQNYIFSFNLTKTSADAVLTIADPDMKQLKYARDVTTLLPPFGDTLVSGDNEFNSTAIKGWYLPLRPQQAVADIGTLPEYVTTSPYLYSGVLYVTTFIPRVKMTNDYDICRDLGHSKLYAFDPLRGRGEWGNGVQSVIIKDAKITGMTAMNGRMYVAIKALKPTALEELPSQMSTNTFIFPDKTMFSFGALKYGEFVPPTVSVDVPYVQYWRDIVNP